VTVVEHEGRQSPVPEALGLAVESHLLDRPQAVPHHHERRRKAIGAV
jgi:hypothetical protein